MPEQKEAPVISEQPTIEAPEIKAPEINKDELLGELTKMGVTKAEDLVGMQRASKEAGNIARMMGEVRQENAELKRMLQQLQHSQSAGYQEPSTPPPIDLGQVVRKEVTTALSHLTQEQLRAQEQIESELAEIETDRNYQAVADIWQKHVANRATNMRLRRGETSLTKEYYKLVDIYKDKMIEAHMNALKAVGKTGVKPPHIEQGETHAPQLPTDDSESRRKLRRINDERTKGAMKSENALEAMVGELFPPEVFGLK